MELIFICLVIIAFLICLLVSKKDEKKSYTRLVRIFYIINTLCLLTSCVVFCIERLPTKVGLEDTLLLWLFFLLGSPFFINCLLRFVFFPYIYFAILTGLYIKDLRKNHFPKKETILFILLLLLSILGLIFLELEFHDLLKHIASF